MADRVEALGGRIDIDSPPGQGTRLAARIPCES
jgi:signal transduction histidine kinase